MQQRRHVFHCWLCVCEFVVRVRDKILWCGMYFIAHTVCVCARVCQSLNVDRSWVCMYYITYLECVCISSWVRKWRISWVCMYFILRVYVLSWVCMYFILRVYVLHILSVYVFHLECVSITYLGRVCISSTSWVCMWYHACPIYESYISPSTLCVNKKISRREWGGEVTIRLNLNENVKCW